MTFVDTLSITTAPEDTSGATKQEVLVHFQNFLLPKVFFVENISAEDLRCDTTSQIFQSFPGETTLDSSIILIELVPSTPLKGC